VRYYPLTVDDTVPVFRMRVVNKWYLDSINSVLLMDTANDDIDCMAQILAARMVFEGMSL
jgi:hypothetical protein